MSQPIQARIREHIIDAWLNGDGRGLANDADLLQSGVLDSFSTLALASFLEEAFRVQLDPTDISAHTFGSVEKIAALVARKLEL